MEESLFLNTLAFEFPKEPKIFYFSLTDKKDISLTKLSHQLFPVKIKDIFPDITNGDTIYTSFEKKIEGFHSLKIDFSKDNFALIKRYYNREIKQYFTSKNILVDPTFIKDNQIWLRATETTVKKTKDCVLYDRYTVKVNYNHFNNTPEIVISYDRQARVYKKSVSAFLAEFDNTNDGLFSETDSIIQNPADLIKKVVYVTYSGKDNKRQHSMVTKYERMKEWIEKGEKVDFKNVYPIINNGLGAFLGYDDEDTENENQFIKKNRYTKYLAKIISFKQHFLNVPEFKKIIPISSFFTVVEPGSTSPDSKSLIFGKNKTDVIPQGESTMDRSNNHAIVIFKCFLSFRKNMQKTQTNYQ